jgi:hypothetical protein
VGVWFCDRVDESIAQSWSPVVKLNPLLYDGHFVTIGMNPDRRKIQKTMLLNHDTFTLFKDSSLYTTEHITVLTVYPFDRSQIQLNHEFVPRIENYGEQKTLFTHHSVRFILFLP